MAENHTQQKHFVLVHGLAHGAWCWYKLVPLLESAGHKVTVLDLAGAGINLKEIGRDVLTFHEYTEPLLKILASLPPNEKFILVGHSLGGMNLSLAMDTFPDKISVAVFLTAFMADTIHKPMVLGLGKKVDFDFDFSTKYCERIPVDAWLDTEILAAYGRPEQALTSMLFGPKFLAFKLYQLSFTKKKKKLYQLSPFEDLELAKTLIRPGSLFIQDLAKAKEFSSKGCGSVRRAYVVCNEDKAIPEDSVGLTKMKVERRTIRMTWKVLLLILLIIASQVLNGGCSRLLHNGTEVSQARGPGSPSGPCNCTYVPGGGN